ncbi:MAG: SDR family NAD(P)-dependent oxidoreductase [bacterium]
MDLNLKNKVVLVTGASRGIGKAIAVAFANEGAQLSLCGRTPGTLDQAVSEIKTLGAEVFAKPTDITNGQQAKAFVNSTLDKFGRIDVLVNNVGGSKKTATLELSDEEWHELLDLNAISAARMSQLVIPAMKKQGGGVILMISSIFGRESGGHITYNAGKAAEISLTKSLAREFAPDNIRVLSVAPGSILFPGGGGERKQKAEPEKIAAFIKSDLPFGRFGKVEEIADVVVFLASERASWVSGTCINVDGCQSRSNI